MRFFAEFILSSAIRFFATLRMTESEGFGMNSVSDCFVISLLAMTPPPTPSPLRGRARERVFL
jgi:hypothetical protein